MLSCSGSADRAHLRSHSGRNAGAALGGAPSAEEYTIDSAAFRVLLLERLRLPLPLTEAVCEGCGRSLDLLGRHRAACTRSGRIKRRGMPIERTLARVCREAGATVKPNVMLVDLNVGVRAGDGRRLEVLAQGLPCRSGKQLAVDVTLRHALTTDGLPRSRTVSWPRALAATRKVSTLSWLMAAVATSLWLLLRRAVAGAAAVAS